MCSAHVDAARPPADRPTPLGIHWGRRRPRTRNTDNDFSGFSHSPPRPPAPRRSGEGAEGKKKEKRSINDFFFFFKKNYLIHSPRRLPHLPDPGWGKSRCPPWIQVGSVHDHRGAAERARPSARPAGRSSAARPTPDPPLSAAPESLSAPARGLRAGTSDGVTGGGDGRAGGPGVVALPQHPDSVEESRHDEVVVVRDVRTRRRGPCRERHMVHAQRRR